MFGEEVLALKGLSAHWGQGPRGLWNGKSKRQLTKTRAAKAESGTEVGKRIAYS